MRVYSRRYCVIKSLFIYRSHGVNFFVFLLAQLSEWRASPSSQPLASAYVKFFGQEIAFANIDKAIVDQVIEVLHLLLYK